MEDVQNQSMYKWLLGTSDAKNTKQSPVIKLYRPEQVDGLQQCQGTDVLRSHRIEKSARLEPSKKAETINLSARPQVIRIEDSDRRVSALLSKADSSVTVVVMEKKWSKPPETFERRARHKTREDRYELKEERRERKQHTEKAELAPQKPKFSRKGKSGISILHEFSAKNVEASRLTLPRGKLGLFGHGRASSPVQRRVHDHHSFSESRFLSHRKDREDVPTVTIDNTKSRRKHTVDMEAEISKFFAQSENDLAEKRPSSCRQKFGLQSAPFAPVAGSLGTEIVPHNVLQDSHESPSRPVGLHEAPRSISLRSFSTSYERSQRHRNSQSTQRHIEGARVKVPHGYTHLQNGSAHRGPLNVAGNYSNASGTRVDDRPHNVAEIVSLSSQDDSIESRTASLVNRRADEFQNHPSSGYYTWSESDIPRQCDAPTVMTATRIRPVFQNVKSKENITHLSTPPRIIDPLDAIFEALHQELAHQPSSPAETGRTSGIKEFQSQQEVTWAKVSERRFQPQRESPTVCSLDRLPHWDAPENNFQACAVPNLDHDPVEYHSSRLKAGQRQQLQREEWEQDWNEPSIYAKADFDMCSVSHDDGKKDFHASLLEDAVYDYNDDIVEEAAHAKQDMSDTSDGVIKDKDAMRAFWRPNRLFYNRT